MLQRDAIRNVEGRVTTSGRRMFCFEFFQILLICVVLGRFLVLGQLSVVLFLGGIGLTFTSLACFCRQDLPLFTDHLGNLRKGKVLTP